MSVAAVSSSNIFTQPPNATPSRIQFQKEFQQLGQDLQTGNLTAAQSDFAGLQKLTLPPTLPPRPATPGPLLQDLDQLSLDLKSGNLAAAQKDYATVQQDLQSASAGAHRHHHHSGGAKASQTLAQEFAQLGQDLSGGNLSAAQQAYSLLQQDLPLSADTGPLTSSAASANSSLSLTA